MTYKLNGVALALQPTTGKWVIPKVLDIAGDGHPIYPAVLSFELAWQLEDPSDYKQIYDAWAAASVSGTVVAELPQFAASTYTFYGYTGTILNQPEPTEYFEGYIKNVKLTISNVRI